VLAGLTAGFIRFWRDAEKTMSAPRVWRRLGSYADALQLRYLDGGARAAHIPTKCRRSRGAGFTI